MTAVFIQAVPWRQDRVENAEVLAAVTGGKVIWDENHSGYSTYLRVLEAMDEEQGIILEDDVLLCVDWRAKVEAAIAQYPGEVINFFGNRPMEPGLHWQHYKSFGGGLCVYFPAGVAKAFRFWLGSRRSQRRELVHDTMLGYYLGGIGKGWYYHVPSLVQHLPYVSAIDEGRATDRQSRTFDML